MKDTFGDVLAQWEANTAKPYGKKKIAKDRRQNKINEKNPEKINSINQIQEAWLRKYGVFDKDAEFEQNSEPKNYIKPEKLKIEAEIDLHGMTSDEAETALEAFFADSVARNYKKVLIIHGKGNHSANEPILKKLVQSFIERNKHAGKSGNEKALNGGGGATWVLLK